MRARLAAAQHDALRIGRAAARGGAAAQGAMILAAACFAPREMGAAGGFAGGARSARAPQPLFGFHEKHCASASGDKCVLVTLAVIVITRSV